MRGSATGTSLSRIRRSVGTGRGAVAARDSARVHATTSRAPAPARAPRQEATRVRTLDGLTHRRYILYRYIGAIRGEVAMALVSVDYVILGMLSTLPSSGYDMKNELDYGGAGYFSALTYGSIYPRLKVLEEEGYIVTLEADAQGRRRRVYDLTPKGWRALEDWLAEPTAFPIPMRDELLLKMVFWTGGRPRARERLIAHLPRRREPSAALLAPPAHRRDHLRSVREIRPFAMDLL